jgi:hypothetical protein
MHAEAQILDACEANGAAGVYAHLRYLWDVHDQPGVMPDDDLS